MWDHNLCNLVAKPLNLNVLDDQRRVLLDRTEVTVGARAFDVLAYLFAHTDRTVSKAELLDHIWSGLIVEKGNLSVQIAGLRKAIGRDMIKTVPGVGYWLIVEAEVAPPPVSALAVPTIPSLAVLPFANLTGSADSDYFVDGIVNEAKHLKTTPAGPEGALDTWFMNRPVAAKRPNIGTCWIVPTATAKPDVGFINNGVRCDCVDQHGGTIEANQRSGKL